MYTKGPWKVGYGNGLSGDIISWGCYLDSVGCQELPIRKNDEAIVVFHYSKENELSVKANANLISAAPELYEAIKDLELFVNTLTHHNPERYDQLMKIIPRSIIDKMAKAEAKAEGKED